MRMARSMPEEGRALKIRDGSLLRRLAGYLRPYRTWISASIGLLILHSALTVATPYLTKVVIDRYLEPSAFGGSLIDPWLPEDAPTGIRWIACIYLVTLLLRFLLAYGKNYTMHWTGQQVMRDLRLEIFQHLQVLGMRFYDRSAVGRLVTRVTNDVETLNETVTSGVVAVFGDVLTLAFILAAMIHLSPELTAVTACLVPFVAAVTLWFRKRARQSYREVRVAVAKLNAYLQEQLAGMVITQLFNRETESHRRFNEINQAHLDANKNAIRAHAWFYPSIEWLGVLGVAVVLVYGGSQVIDKTLTIGVMVAFIQFGTRVFRPIQNLSEKYNILQAAIASLERIFGLLDTPATEEPATVSAPAEAVAEAPAGGPAGRAGGAAGIEFRNVWFAYQDEGWVLSDVSFAVKPGQSLAVVGHTGAGKTTLISLLLRFYDPQRGQILIGGRDIRNWDRTELRRQFGVVLQDPYILQGTIGDNISLSRNEVSTKDLELAAVQANLQPLVNSLSGGYDEPVLERGSSLSTGEKQLISFARALAHRPSFLFLDEATSSVDTETELQMRRAVDQTTDGQTSIVIAHRLSTIRRANRILVLHKGRVREVGSHRELMDKRGVYWRLYQLQYRDQEGLSEVAGPHDGDGSQTSPRGNGYGP